VSEQETLTIESVIIEGFVIAPSTISPT